MFKLIGGLEPLPKAAEDVLTDGDPLIVFAVNAKGETRAYRTSKARGYGVKEWGQASTGTNNLLQRINSELANNPDCATVRSVPQLLKSESGEIVEATLEGSPGCYLKCIGGSCIWVCE
jgi:hypothetical protein